MMTQLAVGMFGGIRRAWTLNSRVQAAPVFHEFILAAFATPILALGKDQCAFAPQAGFGARRLLDGILQAVPAFRSPS